MILAVEASKPAACPICAAKAAWPIAWNADPAVTALLRERGRGAHSWFLCQCCGNAYPATQPDIEILEKVWAQARRVDGSDPAEERKVWEQRRHGSRATARRSFEFFSRLAAGGGHRRFLDIACGLGEAVREFRDHGWSAEGIDADPTTKPFHDEIGIETRIGQFETVDLDRDYDIIHISHAIYFITDPMAFLQRVKQQLAANGLFCIVLADFMAASDRGLPAYAHSFYPTLSSIRYALALAGFETVAWKRKANSVYIAARPAARARLPRVFPRLIRLGYQTKSLRYRLMGAPYLALRRMAKRLLSLG